MQSDFIEYSINPHKKHQIYPEACQIDTIKTIPSSFHFHIACKGKKIKRKMTISRCEWMETSTEWELKK